MAYYKLRMNPFTELLDLVGLDVVSVVENTDIDTGTETVDSFADMVVDAVGAGDALLAYASLGLKATGNDIIASVLGNLAAGCECEVDGNEPIEQGMLRAKLERLERAARYVE